MSYEIVIARLENLRQLSGGDNPKLRAALIRIGTVLEAETKLNISRQKMTKSGRLLNSIKYEMIQTARGMALHVGSFGVEYAAINEYGGKLTADQIQAMFASFKGRKARAGKGVIRVFKDGSGYHKARPYIVALEPHYNFILETLKEAYNV